MHFNQFIRKFIKISIGVWTTVLLLISCGVPLNIIYSPDKTIYTPEAIDKQGGIVIQPGDVLSISIKSNNIEIDALYDNQLVDDEGFINFPILGYVQVSGMTRSELSNLIEESLFAQQSYPQNTVEVEFLDFKISIIGAVNIPGIYIIESGSTNLNQAISLAGGLTIFGQRKSVYIIREIDDEKFIYEVNLDDKNLSKTEAYHLHRNDIIYISHLPIEDK